MNVITSLPSATKPILLGRDVGGEHIEMHLQNAFALQRGEAA
jgi:hypothetical protein